LLHIILIAASCTAIASGPCSFIPKSTVWHLDYAAAINDKGQILFQGSTRNGRSQPHELILTPIDKKTDYQAVA
jgi:hypothetical protein